MTPPTSTEALLARRDAVFGKGSTIFYEQPVHLVRGLLGHCVGGAGARVEVDAQLVDLVDTGRSHGPDVEADAAEVHGPHEVGDVGDHECA